MDVMYYVVALKQPRKASQEFHVFLKLSARVSFRHFTVQGFTITFRQPSRCPDSHLIKRIQEMDPQAYTTTTREEETEEQPLQKKAKLTSPNEDTPTEAHRLHISKVVIRM